MGGRASATLRTAGLSQPYDARRSHTAPSRFERAVAGRYLKINKLCEKSAKNAIFEKKCLTENQTPFTFGIPQPYTCYIFVQALTEREEADMSHEDKSQDAMKPWRQGLVVCLITRL
jgi:hypothetical protein